MQPRDQITKCRPCDEQWQPTCVNAMFRDGTHIKRDCRQNLASILSPKWDFSSIPPVLGDRGRPEGLWQALQSRSSACRDPSDNGNSCPRFCNTSMRAGQPAHLCLWSDSRSAVDRMVKSTASECCASRSDALRSASGPDHGATRRRWGRRRFLDDHHREKTQSRFLRSRPGLGPIHQVAQPLVDKIRIHCTATRHMHNGNARCGRLRANRPLFFIRPSRLVRRATRPPLCIIPLRGVTTDASVTAALWDRLRVKRFSDKNARQKKELKPAFESDQTQTALGLRLIQVHQRMTAAISIADWKLMASLS